jgi:hypothetical protein
METADRQSTDGFLLTGWVTERFTGAPILEGCPFVFSRDEAQGVNSAKLGTIDTPLRPVAVGLEQWYLDVAFQLFSCGMVWDGNLVSKSSRDHLVRAGYAVRADGYQSLTGKGVVAMLTSPPVWASAYRRWRMWKKNPLVASPEAIKRALN